MKNKYDFRKEWPRLERQLFRFSKEALMLAKKGKKEVVHLSRRGGIHINTTALSLKKEHLYHLIGKEYVRGGFPEAHTPGLKRLISELHRVERDITALKTRLNKKKIRDQVTAKKVTRKKRSKSRSPRAPEAKST